MLLQALKTIFQTEGKQGIVSFLMRFGKGLVEATVTQKLNYTNK